ncbi:hypothetical protein D3C77_368260 [compost metagenome]
MAEKVQGLAYPCGDFQGELGERNQQIHRTDLGDHLADARQQLLVLVDVVDLNQVGDLLTRCQHPFGARAVDHVADALLLMVKETFVLSQFVVPAFAVVKARPAVDDDNMHGCDPWNRREGGLQVRQTAVPAPRAKDGLLRSSVPR